MPDVFEEALQTMLAHARAQRAAGQIAADEAGLRAYVEETWKPRFAEIAERVAPHTYEELSAAFLARFQAEEPAGG